MVSEAIFKRAVIVGVIAFVPGFIGPIIFMPSNNMGPIIGIFLTGPLGFFLGALWEIAAQAKRQVAKPLLLWLAGVWIAVLLYTLMLLLPALFFAAGLIALHVAVLVASAIVFRERRSRPVILALLTFIPITILFPPVIRTWWAPELQQPWSGPIPRFAFVNDPLLHAARHVPVLAIHKSALLLEWLVAIAIAALLCFVIERRNGEAAPAVRPV